MSREPIHSHAEKLLHRGFIFYLAVIGAPVVTIVTGGIQYFTTHDVSLAIIAGLAALFFALAIPAVLKFKAMIPDGPITPSAIAKEIITLINEEKQKNEMTPEKVEGELQKWINAFRLTNKRELDPETLFAIVITLEGPKENEHKIVVQRPVAMPAYIGIQTTLHLGPDLQEILNSIDLKDALEFEGMMRLEIGKLGLAPNTPRFDDKGVLIKPKDIKTLTPMTHLSMSKRIPIVSLSESIFLDRFNEIEIAIGLISTSVVSGVMELSRNAKKADPK